MNTATFEETTAIATAVAVATVGASAVAASQQLLLIPLSKLRPSSRNVRKSGGTSIPELASSIARVGLLQNLTVVAAPDGEHYEVVAGRRRLAALKLLAKRRKLARDHEVHCLLVLDDAARTVSLTENVQREAMSPIEELFAWKDLVAEGRPVEDIAADFGVTPLVVQRRLKLANVSPRLLADFGMQAVTLEQLMALAITDDHAAQEAAFYESPQWQRSPEALRDHLTSEEIDASRDAVARFVGADAYEQAGGGVRRDLFADERSGVFLTDGALLDALARDKLAPVAEQVRAEGWAWVDAAPRATSSDLYQFQRARSTRREPGKTEAKRIAKLEEQQAKLQERLDDENEDMADEQAQTLQEEMDELGNELDAIEQKLVEYPPAVVALAGAVVSVDHMGGVVVHRGLLREEPAKALREQARHEEGGAGDSSDASAEIPAKPGISEKLAKRLSAHRTAALQAEVARHPQVALVALVHRLALRVIVDSYGSGGSPVDVSATPQDGLGLHAPDMGEAPAAVGLRKVRQAWADRLPEGPDALFAELLAFPQQELLSLLAVCVACTVNVLASNEEEVPAAKLARAVNLDMHDWWTPTATGYFEHVSKAKALEAVQSFAPDQVNRLGKLKKAEIASEAERLAAGSGWLPVMFRGQEAAAAVEAETQAAPENGACADAEGKGAVEAEVHEGEHATA
ncbi:ParB/RepB/Spo0J family partition protein [Variovorax sp. Root411]|uniref:ParB/RepB/Spo0J family partition protein n=1 Tax=Variovorax sp. Root411 TaxID=1736530 RepID=UPI0006F6940A|nr:ParB/RepB/Spo0J family partition protein [Variovorax sp. Root411]KQW64982.1 chromosome partitioning protein ParB [Variovorax sp. Root411]